MKFLRNNGLDLQTLDTTDLLKRFLHAMRAGLTGQGPLPMLPAMAQIPKTIPTSGTIAAFDVGGTNTRAARIAFHAQTLPTVTAMRRGKMPGASEHVSKEAFYHQLCEVLQPNVHPNEALGYCFSYAFDETNHLLHWTKGIQAPDIVGTDLVKGLQTALEQYGAPNVRIAILNDTVATLLAAYAAGGQVSYAGYVGFILGTGVNVAYAERTEEILKSPTLTPGMLLPINCESGNFTDFPRTTFDDRYEQRNGNGKAQWERCISGVHLGPLCTEMLRQAADEGELSKGMTTYVREHDFNFIDLNHFAAGQKPELFPTTREEQNRIRQWILAIVERAACFAAVNITAAALASAQARGKTHGTILVNADGSTFWKTSCIPFAEKIQTETKRLLQPYGFDLYCLQIEDSPLIGAALAATQI
jgi:hexokinase